MARSNGKQCLSTAFHYIWFTNCVWYASKRTVAMFVCACHNPCRESMADVGIG